MHWSVNARAAYEVTVFHADRKVPLLSMQIRLLDQLLEIW
jgi:hypothetical protein